MVGDRELGEDEVPSGEDSWLAARFGACTGWVDATNLRCPEGTDVPSWLYLPVPYHDQLEETEEPYNGTTSCAATSLVMILDHLGLEDDVNVILDYLAAIPPEQGGYSPDCSDNPVCISVLAMAQVAEDYYCSSVDQHENWDQDQVIEALDGGLPVSILANYGLSPDEAAYGHQFTLIGYTDHGDQVIYHDPWEQWPWAGPDRTTSWDTLEAAWDGPIDAGDPLQPEGHVFWGMTCSG